MTLDPKDTALSQTASLSARPEGHLPEHARIGPYRLLHLVGEGGMGEVWAAEQVEPVHRKVALKVIKAGMDTKQVVARFEAERQALALMDHPAIAKVLDAGATPEGRPYFVMEYVPGVSITQHCDTRRLSTPDRLRLLTEVCDAVQHAHQKAIIHRDLKPSNVLVALSDGRAQPKIIDFGIAKATGQRLTDRTLFTEVGAFIGTPEYMSPEQADLTGQGIDTRTDIYSLGVILYELLTGQLPLPASELRSVSQEELRRRLREVDPPKPSTRLTALGEEGVQVAERRQTDPGALRKQLEGDLDAIVMKALEKDPARRYGTASELAADVERHLRDEPVLARPASRAYRVRKYARRHRLLFLGGGAVAASILAGLLVAGVALVQARRARAEEARQRTLAETRLRTAEKYAEALFLDISPRLANLEGATDVRKRLNTAGSQFLEDLAVGVGDDPRLRWLTARMNLALGRLEGFSYSGSSLADYPAAVAHGERALSLLHSLPPDYPSKQLRRTMEYRTEDLLETALDSMGRVDEALGHADRMKELALTSDSDAEKAEMVRLALLRRASILTSLGRIDDALEIRRKEVAQADAQLRSMQNADRLHSALVAHASVGDLLLEKKDVTEAIAELGKALELARRLVAGEPTGLRYQSDLGMMSTALGGAYLLAGRYDEARALVKDGVQRLERLERSDPENQRARDALANALDDLGARELAAAERPGVPNARRRALLAGAIDSWTRCRERTRAERAHHFECGGSSLERARALLAQKVPSAPSRGAATRGPSP